MSEGRGSFQGLHPESTESFFDKLQLVQPDRLILKECFKPENFKLKVNRDLIQQILGAKLRAKAVEQTSSEFKNSPLDSPNYPPIAWQVRQVLYQQLTPNQQQQLANQLQQEDVDGI
ncbi:hypothetical protein, partial [Piscirickettsia salmonis]